jgi:hypothetical protein
MTANASSLSSAHTPLSLTGEGRFLGMEARWTGFGIMNCSVNDPQPTASLPLPGSTIRSDSGRLYRSIESRR